MGVHGLYSAREAGPKQEYNWRGDAISDYESLWILVQRFAYLNAVSVKEIFDLFAARGTEPPRLSSSSKFRSFSEYNQLDSERFRILLGVPRNILDNAVVSAFQIVPPVPLKLPRGNRTRRPPEILRYCPQCIKSGFHSAIFQLEWIIQCPIHRIPLVEQCPKCRKPLLYGLYKEALANPFGCSCGYLLWTERDSLFWKKGLSRRRMLVLDAFRSWCDELRQRPEYMLHGLTSESRLGAWNDHVEHIKSLPARLAELHPVGYGWPQSAFWKGPRLITEIIRCGIPTREMRIDREADSTVDTISREVGTLFGATKRLDDISLLLTNIKAIDRHIRNHVLRSHRDCIRGAHPASIGCPWAWAYWRWVGYWGREELVSSFEKNVLYEETERIVSTNVYEYRFPLATRIQAMLQYPRDDGERIERPEHALPQWVIQHVFGLYLFATFYETCKRLIYDGVEDGPSSRIKQVFNPLFLVSLSEKYHLLSIYWWRAFDLDQIRKDAAQQEHIGEGWRVNFPRSKGYVDGFRGEQSIRTIVGADYEKIIARLRRIYESKGDDWRRGEPWAPRYINSESQQP